MKNNKFYILLSILTIIFLFSFSAVCNRCATANEEEMAEEEEEIAEEVDEEMAEEEEEEEEEEITEEETEEEEVAEEDMEEPTIELEVDEGPLYSSADGVCYWRVKAIVTGTPAPTVEFNKDDSGGAWGSKKVQINLNDPGDTFTLTATATNTKGTATDSMDLSWECEEEITDDLIIETPESEIIFTPSDIKLYPSDIGYIVYPSGINTETLIIGDSISNTDVRGYFAFDLSPVRGKTIKTITLTLENPTNYGVPAFKGKIYLLVITSYLPLSADDYDSLPVPIGWVSYENSRDPIIFEMGESSVGFALLQSIVDSGGKLECSIKYENDLSDGDSAKDGREYKGSNISLVVVYED